MSYPHYPLPTRTCVREWKIGQDEDNMWVFSTDQGKRIQLWSDSNSTFTVPIYAPGMFMEPTTTPIDGAFTYNPTVDPDRPLFGSEKVALLSDVGSSFAPTLLTITDSGYTPIVPPAGATA